MPAARRVAIGPEGIKSDHEVRWQKTAFGMNAPDENNTSYSVSSYSVCSVAETAVRNRPNDFSRRDSPDRDRFGHLYYSRDARGRFRWAKRGQQQGRHKECHLPHFIHHLIADITWVRRRCSKGVPPDGGALLDFQHFCGGKRAASARKKERCFVGEIDGPNQAIEC